MSSDLSQLSMLDLFRMEVEAQTAILSEGLLALERKPDDRSRLEELMRAAHSLKGAARLVGYPAAVQVAHGMEDSFVAAQQAAPGRVVLDADLLLRGVDLLARLAQVTDTVILAGMPNEQEEIDAFLEALAHPYDAAIGSTVAELPASAPLVSHSAISPVVAPEHATLSVKAHSTVAPGSPTPDRTIRIAADHLNKLLDLSGESLVNSRGFTTMTAHLLRLKQLQDDVMRSITDIQDALDHGRMGIATGLVRQAQQSAVTCREMLTASMTELEAYDRRATRLSQQTYQEVLAARMRPFADGVQGFPRMVRDVAQRLGKRVALDVVGENTPVDRDILQRMEAPLGHLLRNVVDHGIESPDERVQLGKQSEGRAILQARHSAGMLLISITDDGRGVDPEVIRHAIVTRSLATAELAEQLSVPELLEFLFLPGFSLKTEVTDISGRGVGLDVVRSVIKEIGGTVQVTSTPGTGMCFQLQLPLTLSVIRTLLVQVGSEPYALPLTRVSQVFKVPRSALSSVEGRQYANINDRHIGLIAAHHVLELSDVTLQHDTELSVVLLGDRASQYGVVFDALLGERELVVRPLDSRLGKIPNISAAALMPDGSPALIIDVDDFLRSIETLVSGGRLASINPITKAAVTRQTRGRVLVADDSITVRETERKLLQSGGYEVDVAVDGMDAWNAIRTGHYDLLVTDVDMPRLDGIELTKMIRADPRLRVLPVMIVSYKDREEDRMRGLEAGADYYLTKASFQDDTLLRAAADLVGDGA